MSHPLRGHLTGQGQQADGISLVVVSRVVATSTDGGHHLVFAGIALAGGVFLDRADRNSLIRDLVVQGKRRTETAPGQK